MNHHALFAVTQSYYSTNTSTATQNSSDQFIQSLTSASVFAFLASCALLLLAIVFFIRWWMVQSSVFAMRDDILEIKFMIRKASGITLEDLESIATVDQPVEQEDSLQSAQISVQAEKPVDGDPVAIVDQLDALDSLKKPSKVFIWLLGLVIVVFIVLMLIGFFIVR